MRFSFSIVNFPYLCSNIPITPVHGFYISQLIGYARACSTYDQFFIQCIYWQTSWCHRGLYSLVYRWLPQILQSLQLSSVPVQSFFRPNAMCFIPIITPFLIHWSWRWFVPLNIYLSWNLGSQRMWQVDRGCLLLQGTWFHLWYIQRSVFAPFSNLYFQQDLWDWWLFVIYAIS
jgi:hypothetical protein